MSTQAIAAQVRDAHATGAPCRIIGAGTWLDAGHPVNGEVTRIRAGATRGIMEYVPGDLTLTAHAGTPLAELHDATLAHGQRLALDPYGSDSGTIGATVATNAAGLSAAAFGAPRDQVLGLAFVTGTGDVVRAGGRVVKNVAGFDLVRLCTGAWGTLGVITEVSVRLRAMPAVDVTLVISLDAADDAASAHVIDALRAVPFTFECAELLDAATAAAAGVAGAPAGALVVRAAASADVVRAMRASLAPIGDAHDADPGTWGRLRTHEPAGGSCIRLSHAPARGAQVWAAACRLADAVNGRAHMSVGRGVARVVAEPDPGESAEVYSTRIRAALGQGLSAFDGTVIAERLPAQAWHAPALHRARADAKVLAGLTRGVRDAFDPARLLNRGILGLTGGDT